jgi:hypothetical protein
MNRKLWEVRLGRRVGRNGVFDEAFVAHILDESGKSVRNRWFKSREDAELWAKANQANVQATEDEVADSPIPPSADYLTDEEVLRILDQGGLCAVADVRLMAGELLAWRATRTPRTITGASRLAR